MGLNSITDNNRSFIIKSIKEGLSLTLEENDQFINVIPLRLENDAVVLIDHTSDKQIVKNINEIKIIQEFGPQVSKEEQSRNINNIQNRTSDIILGIEYWDENFNLTSDYDEYFMFLRINDNNYLELFNTDTSENMGIRMPFLRYIEFEGQKQRELLSNTKQPQSKYDGYKYYNAAQVLISNKSIQEIVDSTKCNEIKLLLLKTTEDLSISSNITSASFKILGEIEEENRNNSEAITYYKKALDLNPKIGLKNKLKKLLN